MIRTTVPLCLLLALWCPQADADKPDPAQKPDAKADKITWKKTVLDKVFRSEGVSVADVNKDGKLDIINGEAWYEAPTWKMHEIRKLGNYTDGDKNLYSQSFACWVEDINSDGWMDVIVIGFPGAPCHWYENPQNKEGHWKQHEIWHSACNETPLYTDLLGLGKRVLIMGWQPRGQDNAGQMAYFTPDKDVTKPWVMHAISDPSTLRKFVLTADKFKALEKDQVPEAVIGKLAAIRDMTFDSEKDFVAALGKNLEKADLDANRAKLLKHAGFGGVSIPGTFRFSHGLGVGDVNGDGRQDVLSTDGWWEQPVKVQDKPWTFHPAQISPACADMFVYDLDNDGKNDIISSSAHNYGIWAAHQKPGMPHPTFLRKDIFPKLVSQTHAMHAVDINGDGLKDLVTGKRWWAHGPKGDADPNAPAKVYWFEAKKDKDGIVSFTPHEIDNDSGIGTQFYIGDVNGDGLLDVVTSNKKGTFLLTQVREAK